MKRAAKKKWKKIFGCYIPILLFTIFTIFPFYWFLCTSFKEESSIMELPIRYIPVPFTLDNYKNMLASMGFDRYFFNSLFVSVLTTVIVILVAIWGGFAISRYKFRGKKFTFFLLLITQMLPGVVILIPLFTVFNRLGLINNLWSLVITNTTVNLPFCMIMMSGFFSGIPSTLEEAAQIDGCSIWKAIFKIVVPAIMPGVVSSAAFAFVNSWNEFVYALNFINDSSKFTLPVGLSMMKGEFTVNYGGLAAGTIVALIPVLLIFCYIQKYLVQGLAAGAVKG
ncbi:MAG: carbohydrate ABC transporter permease [Lachnospiraceae bacterium]|jgi:multiple sugar transport system permease protein|nr:carbohydrate ABC transporter permease [Lachnospiraceae bacterium]MCI8995431.1 carbohydrate ABC transporter permease [Lachnospiraceae bacterium]MCI9133843.1 carbohydrate ABC transporter permease [Lachnospiraceae bacterium]